jgi:hypothetical protein
MFDSGVENFGIVKHLLITFIQIGVSPIKNISFVTAHMSLLNG